MDKFGIGLDGANNFVITNGTTATPPWTISGDGSGFLFDPPLPGGERRSSFLSGREFPLEARVSAEAFRGLKDQEA